MKEATVTATASATATAGTSAQTLSANDLVGRMIERRAIEAVVWGMPAVNYELMYQALVRAKGGWNQIVYYSRLPDWKNQTLTPNPDTIYFLPFYNTQAVGPLVLEIPPAEGGSITGSVDDGWQTAIEDVGPAGIDKGKGGKYLILPPGYTDPVPAGYTAMPSSTFAGFAILRSNVGSGSEADIAKAVAYGKQIKLFPLSQASDPPATTFVDVVDVIYDSTIPYDVRFFRELDRFVQREPWLERDRAMIDVLKSVGIAKGKPFEPDAGARALFEQAAREARAWLDLRYEDVFSPPYFPKCRWALPASQEVVEALSSNFAKPDSYPVDGRGLTFSFAFFSARHLGGGQFYLMAIKDKAGASFDGGKSYRLRVPPNPPVTLYWSATAYDRATHALIREVPRASRASNSPGLQKNPDDSVDVFLGPDTPPGKEANWIPTRRGGEFEVLFRLYGPQQPLFDKTWVLPDIEEVSAR